MISSTKTTLAMIVNGSIVNYTPKSLNGIEITVGTVVTLPPANKSLGDNWDLGISAKVEDCDDRTGDLMVFDGSEWFCVEPDRVVVGDVSPEEFNRLLSERDARLDAELESEEKEVEQLKDEKNGLYPDKVDIAN